MKYASSLKKIFFEKLPSTGPRIVFSNSSELGIPNSANDEESTHSATRLLTTAIFSAERAKPWCTGLSIFCNHFSLFKFFSQFCQLLAQLDDYVNHNLLLKYNMWLWHDYHFYSRFWSVLCVVCYLRDLFSSITDFQLKRKNGFHNLVWQNVEFQPHTFETTKWIAFYNIFWNSIP